MVVVKGATIKERSVFDLEHFCGWNALDKLVKKAKTQKRQALIAALFLTGGRVSEVLRLRKANFDLFTDEDLIVVKAMPVLKHFKKIGVDKDGKWITKKQKSYRTFSFLKNEPLVPYLVNWFSNRGEGRLFNYTRVGVYAIVRELDKAWWPHRFRSERASQLAFDYGFGLEELLEWFYWMDLKTARHYTHFGYKALGDKMRKYAKARPKKSYSFAVRIN